VTGDGRSPTESENPSRRKPGEHPMNVCKQLAASQSQPKHGLKVRTTVQGGRLATNHNWTLRRVV
jgi:hypothetical protein